MLQEVFNNTIVRTVFFILVGTVLLLLILPLSTYLRIFSLLKPQAMMVNNQAISWNQLQNHVKLVEQDKSLRTKAQKLEAAANQAVELAIIKQNPSVKVDGNLSVFDQLTTAHNQINQNDVNWRTGGYLIARFADPQATESAVVLKREAFNAIYNLKQMLNQGMSFKNVLAQAEQDPTIKKLNKSAFLPGMYLEKITPDKFPLAIKTMRSKFFSMPSGSVSEVLTLNWDDYDGPTDGGKFTGDFAYAVIKMENGKKSDIPDYQTWLKKQEQQAKISSFIPMPFFFKWF